MAWLDVEAFDCCTCLYVCTASAVCDFLISVVWRKLTNKGCASMRLGKMGSETFEMLKQAFGDSCMSRSRTFEWFGRFKNGRTSTANDDRSGRPSTATTPQMWNRYGRLSTRIVVVPYTISVQRLELVMDLLTEQLNMHQIAAKFVPRVLSQDISYFHSPI